MKMHKEMVNAEIAELLRAVASAYQLKNIKNARFRIIAYNRAADAIEHLSSEAKDLWDDGKLSEVSGVGESIGGYLEEIFRSGKSEHFEEVLSNLPPAMFDLIKVSGIGAKTAYKLASEFSISPKNPLDDLKKLAMDGKIRSLEGFGEESEKAIIESIEEVEGRIIRLLLPYAEEIANEIIEWLKKDSHVKRADALGSLRRKVSTIGDVDLACASTNTQATIKHFTEYPNKTRVLEQGDRSASIIIPGDKQIDLMVEKPESYGSLLQHFTGSKHHNIHLRKIALKKGYSLSDYGARDQKTGKLKVFSEEEELYQFLGMDWIPPELREDNGEIEAAIENAIPKLITEIEIKGDLQIHSDFDIETNHDLGVSTMEEIVNKAKSLNYEYVAFTEHNPSHSKHTNKQIIELLKRKKDAIDKLNYSSENRTFNVFNSLEIDILPDGSLPVPDDGLALLDFALVSIHSSFKMPKKKMTSRVLRALDNPKVKIFAHPTARKLNEREGIDLDWDKIFDFCLQKSIWIEINASPSRLDLPDVLVKEAISRGLKLTLGTDSHASDHMDLMKYGVYVARRGWASADDIINTRSLFDFKKALKGGDLK